MTPSSRTRSGSCTGTYSGFGNFQAGDGTMTGLIHSWAATLTNTHGNHTMRYGVDLRAYYSNGFAGGYDVAPGFQFLPTYTNGPFDNSAVAPVGQEYAPFLLGIPDRQMTRSASYAAADQYLAGYVQDDWKVSRKLTLNLGLRYEYEAPMTERYDRAVRGFDRTTLNKTVVRPRCSSSPPGTAARRSTRPVISSPAIRSGLPTATSTR